MKGRIVLFIAAMAALVVAVSFVPVKAYAADVGYIERLVPAETQEAETGGGEMPFTPVMFEKATGLPGLSPGETQEVDLGGIPWPERFEKEDAAGRIERLSPSE